MNGKIIWPKSRKTAPALEIPYFQRVSISVVQDINPSESVDSDGFPFVFVTFPGQLFLPFLFDPNRDPYGISERSGLETTREDTAHRFGGLTLGGRGHVGVGVQGEAGLGVAQDAG